MSDKPELTRSQALLLAWVIGYYSACGDSPDDLEACAALGITKKTLTRLKCDLIDAERLLPEIGFLTLKSPTIPYRTHDGVPHGKKAIIYH